MLRLAPTNNNVRIFHFYIFVNNEERVSFNFRLKLEDLKASKSPGPFKRVLCLWPILTVAINVQYAFCLSRRPPPPGSGNLLTNTKMMLI